jgi:hypothetical protein
MTNPQWYERFNTKVDVGEAIGVARLHKVLLEHVAKELHQKTFASLTSVEQQAVRTDTEERYIAYAFLRQSGAQHANIKVDLQNDNTTGLLQVIIVARRTVSRAFTYWINTVRPLYRRRTSREGHRSHRREEMARWMSHLSTPKHVHKFAGKQYDANR